MRRTLGSVGSSRGGRDCGQVGFAVLIRPGCRQASRCWVPASFRSPQPSDSSFAKGAPLRGRLHVTARACSAASKRSRKSCPPTVCRLPCGRGGAGSGTASTSPRFQERVWAQSCWAAVDPSRHGHATPAWVAYCSCWLISARSPCGSSASTVIAHHPGASAGRLPFRVAQHRPPLDTHGCQSANSSSMRDSSPARSPQVPVTVPACWERPGQTPGSGACHLRTGRVKGVRTPLVVSPCMLGVSNWVPLVKPCVPC